MRFRSNCADVAVLRVELGPEPEPELELEPGLGPGLGRAELELLQRQRLVAVAEHVVVEHIDEVRWRRQHVPSRQLPRS